MLQSAGRQRVGSLATITVGTWKVAPALNLIERDGVSIKLEPRVMDLLVYFANAGDRVVSADELLRDVWQGRVFDDGIVYNKIKQLRKALGDEPHTPRFIETIPKRGYRLVAAVTLAATDERAPVGRADDVQKASATITVTQPRRRWFFWAAGGFGAAIAVAALLAWSGPGTGAEAPVLAADVRCDVATGCARRVSTV